MLVTDNDIRYYYWPDYGTRHSSPNCAAAAYAVKNGHIYPYYAFDPGEAWNNPHRYLPTSVVYFDEKELVPSGYRQAPKEQLAGLLAGRAAPLPIELQQNLEAL